MERGEDGEDGENGEQLQHTHLLWPWVPRFGSSAGYQSQKMGLFPFCLFGGDFDHGKIMGPA